jgi:hypothetical protein
VHAVINAANLAEIAAERELSSRQCADDSKIYEFCSAFNISELSSDISRCIN